MDLDIVCQETDLNSLQTFPPGKLHEMKVNSLIMLMFVPSKY